MEEKLEPTEKIYLAIDIDLTSGVVVEQELAQVHPSHKVTNLKIEVGAADGTKHIMEIIKDRNLKITAYFLKKIIGNPLNSMLWFYTKLLL